jgi:hypothetical protein
MPELVGTVLHVLLIDCDGRRHSREHVLLSPRGKRDVQAVRQSCFARWWCMLYLTISQNEFNAKYVDILGSEHWASHQCLRACHRALREQHKYMISPSNAHDYHAVCVHAQQSHLPRPGLYDNGAVHEQLPCHAKRAQKHPQARGELLSRRDQQHRWRPIYARSRADLDHRHARQIPGA